MRAITRPETPEALRERGEEWTSRWVVRQSEGGDFAWPQYGNRKLNRILLEPLQEMTQDRCAFCDGILGVTSRETIEHFRPKAGFPELAFAWPNLFPACDFCQAQKQRNGDWDEGLLPPDEAGYRFSRFFYCDPDTGEINPNPAASEADQKRAKVTTRLFGLNTKKRRKSRRREWRRYRRAKGAVQIDDLDCRFFVEALVA